MRDCLLPRRETGSDGVNPIVIPVLGGAGLGSLSLGDGPLGAGGAGNVQIPHNLGRVPYAVVPVMQSGGLIRLRSTPFDATYIYLSISAAGTIGFVAVW